MDLAECRAFLLDRSKKRAVSLDKRFQEAWRDCRAIAGLIATRYQPRRIYQWGSLLHRAEFSEISDIDLAVEGVWSV